MKYIITICTVLYIFLSVSCKKQDTYGVDENDTTRGIWGFIELYDEFGNKILNASGVNVIAHCIDTLSVDTAGNPTAIFDTILTTTSDNKGSWMFNKAPSGRYTIAFSKEGFCNNQYYNFSYDTSRADTLDLLYLSVKPLGSMHIESIALSENVLQIDRTINFESPQSISYMLSTWYFFDTVPEVSKDNYLYSYVSGAAVSVAGASQRLVTQKPLDKLYESGIRAGQTVYMVGYVDNAKYVSYKISETEFEFPNVSEPSNVESFILPEE